MLEGALVEALALLAKHGDVIEAVIALAEKHSIDSVTLVAALKQVLKDTSDASMKAELGA